MLRKALPFLLATAALCGSAMAEEPSGCASFKWDVAQDQAALAAQAEPSVESGGALALGQAARVRLIPVGQIHFASPPERPPRPGTLAAIVQLPAPPSQGLYRVSLSEGAWIDTIQNGATAKPRAFSGARDCPHIRKSLKFELSATPTTIQISNVSAQKISVIVTRD